MFFGRICRFGHRTHLYFTKRSSRLPAGHAERLGKLDVSRPKLNLFVRRYHIDQLFLVHPAFDSPFGDPNAYPVPFSPFEIHKPRRFIFRRIHAVETGNSKKRSAPTTDNEAAKSIAYRH